MFRARCGRSTCSAAAICAAYLLPVLLASANGAVYGQALGSGGQLAEEAAGLSESEPHSDPRVRLREETASPQVRRLTVTAQQRCCVKARFCSQSQSVLFAVHVVTALSTASSGLRIQALACTAPTFCCAHTQSAASRGSLASRGRGAHKPPVILASKEEVRPAVCGLRFSNGLVSSRRVSATWKRVCANRVRSAGAVRPERQGRDAPHRADAARRGRPLPKQLGVGRSGALGPRTCPRAGTGTAGSAVRPAACPTCTCGAGSGPAEAAAVQHIPLRRMYLKTLPGVHTAPSRSRPASAPCHSSPLNSARRRRTRQASSATSSCPASSRPRTRRSTSSCTCSSRRCRRTTGSRSAVRALPRPACHCLAAAARCAAHASRARMLGAATVAN